MSKKLVTERSLEELVGTLDSTEAPEGEQIYDPILKFIAEYDIKDGTDVVASQIIYRLFKLRYPTSGINRRQFTRRFGEFFEHHETGNKPRKFKINLSAFNLSNESYKILEAKKTRTQNYSAAKTQFEKFLAVSNLKKGTYFVPAYLLYYMFDEWCFNTQQKPRLQGKMFSDFCKLFFERKNPLPGKHYFGIDYGSVKDYLTPERMEIINNWGSKIYGKKRKYRVKNKKEPAS